jgi:hypothetical protein
LAPNFKARGYFQFKNRITLKCQYVMYVQNVLFRCLFDADTRMSIIMTTIRQLLLIPYAILIYQNNISENVPMREYELAGTGNLIITYLLT